MGSRGSVGLEGGGLGAQGHRLTKGSERNLGQEDSYGEGRRGAGCLDMT